jgi:hypothetical protein
VATPAVSASLGLYQAARKLTGKGRYAGAAEKYGAAAAAAVQELAAEDCLVVALLRAEQAQVLISHSFAPGLTVAEIDQAPQTVSSVLLPQLVTTLMRRKAAGTLLPGSCRAAEVAWWRAYLESKMTQEGNSVKEARTGAEALSPTLGFDVFMYAASAACKVLLLLASSGMSREVQLSHAAFVASAFELMAQPRELPCVTSDGGNRGSLASGFEQMLAQIARQIFRSANVDRHGLDGEALALMVDAWQRVERSGAIAMRRLEEDVDAKTAAAGLAAAAKDAAVRGLHECAQASCAAKEVHVSQFKKCGACRTVAYCCREHQVADWPAHKAACKAARSAAAAATDAA